MNGEGERILQLNKKLTHVKPSSSVPKKNGEWPVEKKVLRGNDLSLKAFTTLEILVILGIVGVVMALSYPPIQRYLSNGHLRSAARAVVADFAQMKQRAMTGDPTVQGFRVHRLALNLGANQYALQRCTGTANPCPGWEDIEIRMLNQFGNDIAFDPAETNPLNIEFQARGTVNNARIVLTNGRASRARIESNISGRTYVVFNMQ
jgi:type II secretory pathway pseudopilin PulG